VAKAVLTHYYQRIVLGSQKPTNTTSAPLSPSIVDWYSSSHFYWTSSGPICDDPSIAIAHTIPLSSADASANVSPRWTSSHRLPVTQNSFIHTQSPIPIKSNLSESDPSVLPRGWRRVEEASPSSSRSLLKSWSPANFAYISLIPTPGEYSMHFSYAPLLPPSFPPPFISSNHIQHCEFPGTPCQRHQAQ